MAHKFEIYKDNAGEFRVRFKYNADSEVIAPTIPRNSRPGFRADPAHRSD